jgi:uncharacterized spore protein YtfJ
MTEKTVEDVIDRAAARAVDALKAVFGEASPNTVFSTPERVDDDLIVTAVAWERAGGFGFGGGGEVTNGETEGAGTGAGGGGGGTSQGRPVAVIRIGSNGVEVKPVIDFTKIGVTLLLSFIGVWRVLRR